MNTRSKAESMLFVTTFIWGSTFVVTKILSSEISPSLYIFIRFAFGGLFFFVLFHNKLKSISALAWKHGILLGLMLGAVIVIQNYGIYQTTASKAAFITGLMVIFTPLAQIYLEGRNPKLGSIIGILVVTIGLYLLTSPEGKEINTGDVLVLVSAALFGIFIVYLDIFSKQHDIFQLSFIQIIGTSAVAGLVAPFEKIYFSISLNSIGLLLYMGLFATVVTTFVQTKFQKDTTPTRAVIIFTIEPVIASILAYFVLREVMSITGIFGGILIIVGILISEFSDQLIPFQLSKKK